MNDRPSLLKKEARILLAGRWPVMNLAAAVYLTAQFLSYLLISRFLPAAGRMAFALISATAVGLILKLLTGLLRAGVTRIALRVARQQKLMPGDIFYAVRSQPDRYLMVGVIFTVIELLYALPLVFYLIISGINTSLELGFLTAWALLGALFLLWFHLTYGLAVPLLLDDPAASSLDAMKKSAALMKGQRFRLFRLELSFIGWILIIVMSAFFGTLWILPYFEESRVLFYLGLVRDDVS